ncbi:MAG TPA: methylated-DNA--[protein]-cysteine S-methyltransferase [Dongiaceae bacterium]|nr:methylated-DNA--[protein]-cysteine S-methyltransferase [Dongiaceae bacterium]
MWLNESMHGTVYRRWESPIGTLLLAGGENALTRISFDSGSRRVQPEAHWEEHVHAFDDAVEQLKEYFAAQRRQFDLRLRMEGTEFQKKVWNGLLEIPYGETISYKVLAQRIGNAGAVRAVGAANGANPLPIIVPCHRVIGNDGSLTGFGGGLPLKKKLLELESRQLRLL